MHPRFVTLCVRLLAALLFVSPVLTAAVIQEVERVPWNEQTQGPLPRWREGGTPEPLAEQSLHPYAVHRFPAGSADLSGPPTSGLISSPPEYSPSDGVLFRYGSNSWPDVVTECVVKLTADPTKDEIAYVVVTNANQQTKAINAFTAGGADMSKVMITIESTNSIWLRDYGPHFIWQNGALAVADSHYYPTRPLDNFIPTLVANDVFGVPAYPMGLYYSGGNFQPGPNRSAFITALIYVDNGGFGLKYIESLFNSYQGIDTLHIFPQLPNSVDGTGHIDMWMYLVDEDSVIIGEFLPGSNATAIQITNNAVPYMEALGFTVHRVPAWNVGATHYTYTNAFRVNDRIFIPSYASGNITYFDDDRDAILAWEAAAGPSVEIVPIDCYSIIPAAGAIHCIVMQVPRYSAAVPAAHIVAPSGGELLVPGEVLDLQWAASDDVAITSVDLAYSTDGGQTFPYTIATGEPDDGHFPWTVPGTASPWTVVQATAHDGSGNSGTAASETMLEVCNEPQVVYDFTSGAGVDRWIWGDRTQDWSELERTRYPVALASEIESLVPGAYAAIASSNATGGDTDTNRYRSLKPSGGAESTHVIEFTIAEDPATIRDVGLLWEGYGDACLQVELYVWDNVLGNWGDGRGNNNENKYLANWAGNVDESLEAHIRKDISRYIDTNGKLTLLLYAERSNQKTYHDFVRVTITLDGGGCGPWGDLGSSMAGASGHPKLVGSGTLVAGDPMDLTVLDALENAATALVIGLSDISIPFQGGVLVPSLDVILGGLVTDPSGSLTLSMIWPSGVPAATSMFLQAWILDGAGLHGFAASNAARGTTP